MGLTKVLICVYWVYDNIDLLPQGLIKVFMQLQMSVFSSCKNLLSILWYLVLYIHKCECFL